MNANLKLIVGILLLSAGTCLFGATSTSDLIKEAKKIARRRKIAPTRAAFEKVLAAKDATPAQKALARMEIAKVLLAGRKPRFKEGFAEFEKALAISGLPESERFAILLAKAAALHRRNLMDRRGSYHTRGIDAARKIYAEVSASKNAPNNVRIEAFNGLADCLLDKLLEKEAVEVLKKALALPGLTVSEKESAEFNLARCHRRQTHYDIAKRMYDRLLATTKNAALKRKIIKDYLRIYFDQRDVDGAVAFMKRQGYSKVNQSLLLSRNRAGEKANEILFEVVADAKAKPRDRWTALVRLTHTPKYDLFKERCGKYLDETIAKDPKKVTVLLTFFSRSHMGPYYVRYNSRTNPAFLVWAGKKLLAYDKLKTKDRLNVSKHMINAWLDLGALRDARKLADELSTNPELKPSQRSFYEIVSKIIGNSVSRKEIAKMAKQLLDSPENAKLANIKKAELLGDLAKFAVRAYNQPAGSAIDELRSKFIVREPRRSLDCMFVEQAPSDISAWLEDPAINEKGRYGVFDRKYGNNLKNLIATDSSSSGRATAGSTTNAGDDKFSVVCDPEGLHFFFLAPCSNPEDVAAGLEKTASYEMYLAPGKNEPYHTFIPNAGARRFFDSYHTMYPNKHYRPINQKAGTLFWDSKATKKGVALYIRIPWIALYDKIPRKGDKYEFEAIHWASGGRSWGGSKSVHNRSSFGDLVFSNMTEKARTAIKRRIIKTAYDRYKKEKVGNHNGVLDFWEDPELGDPDFYDSCLRKMVAELDDYGKMIKAGMTDEVVNLLFEKAVPKWMEIKYVVPDLRKKYMSDKMFGAQASAGQK